MQTLSLLLSQKWRSSLCCLAVALAALVALPSITSAQVDTARKCAEIIEQTVECKRNPNGGISFEWCFTFRNRTNFTVTHVGSANGTFPLQQPVQPGGTGRTCLTIAGTPGSTITITAWFCREVRVNDTIRDSIVVGTRMECCEQRYTLRLPMCENDSTKDCADIFEQEITCNPNSAGALDSYNWCFSFRNNTNFTITQVNAGWGAVPISPVQPGGTGRVCVPLRGAPGSTITVTLSFCYEQYVRDSAGPNGGTIDSGRVICCEQRVVVRLPECKPEGCIRIVEQSQELICDPNNPGGYLWCFSFVNTWSWPINSIGVGNSMVSVGPIPPGGTGRACVRFTGQPGPTSIVVLACFDSVFRGNGHNDTVFTETVCCEIRYELKLPECGHERDCCDGFIINLANATPVAAPNGLTGLLGLIGAGPNAITKVSATIVSASVNGQPAFAYFNSGTILNPLGAGVVTPPPFGQEVIWNSAAGVPMNAPSLFLNWLRLPPMAPNARRDTVTFCIRWRFTDVNCRTCDTMICYRVIRNQFFFNTGVRTENEKGGSILGGDGRINGELTGQNSGSLSITFPELPAAEFGEVSFTGMRIQADENVRISAVTSPSSVAAFTTEHGLASGSFDAKPGDELNLNLNYENLGGRAALGHFLMVSYTSSLLPGVEQQMPISVTLRQAGTATGGDQVDAIRVEVASKEVVQTFALHLRNANTSGEALSGLRIVAGDGVKLLAVGPTSSETEALLRFGAEGEGGRAYVSEASEGTVSLAAGSERNPIYITLAMNEEADPMIHFATLNGLDETVSQGDLNLSQISSVSGGVTGTSISLGQSAPNPTTGEVAIGIHMTSAERVSLVIRDLSGREVLRLLDNELLTTGAHVVTADVSDLTSGTYFYTLETAAGNETRKMSITK